MDDQPPINLTDLTRSLRLVAQRAQDPAVAAEYRAAADQLDNAIRMTDERGDKALRNTLQTALGMAELSMSDHLDGVSHDVRALASEIRTNTSVVNELHQRVADQQSEQREHWEKQGAALETVRREFRDGLQAVGERMSDVEAWRADVNREIASFRQSRDQSIAERAAQREDLNASKADRKLIHDELERATGERAALQVSVNALTDEVQFLRNEIREIRSLVSGEADDASGG